MRNIIIVSNRFHTFEELYDLLSNAGYSHIHHAIDSSDLSHMLYRLKLCLIIVDTGIPREELLNLVKLLNNPISKITLFLLPAQHDGSVTSLLSERSFTNFISRPLDSRILVNTVSEMMDINQHNF